MRVIVAFIILIGCHLSWGQTNELGLDILQVEQEISDDVAQLFPLNLNTADSVDLINIPFTCSDEIHKILEHRRIFGGFLHVLELQQCGLRQDRILEMIPYVYVVSINPDREGGKLYVCRRYRSTNHTPAYRACVRHHFGFLTLNILADQDFDEPWRTIKGFAVPDHVTASMTYHKKNRTFIAGDYRVDLGEGLLFGQGYRPGPSADVQQLSRPGTGLRMNTSAEECRYFRGVASEYQRGGFRFIAFLSADRKDGILLNQLKLDQTGYHRTETEIQRRKALEAKECGYSVAFQNAGLTVGTSAYAGRFRDVNHQIVQPFAQTIYGHIRQRSGRFFFEAGLNQDGQFSVVWGAQYAAGRQLDVGLVHRRLDRSLSPYANVFARSSKGENEEGVFATLTFRHGGWSHTFTSDLYSKLFPTENQLAMGLIHRFQWLTFCKLSKTDNLHVRIRVDQDQDDYALKFRLHGTKQMGRDWRIQSRLEATLVDKKYGVMGYFDNRFTRGRFACTLRTTMASIPSFQHRIYVYETDVPYQYNFAALTSSCLRQSVYIRYRLSNHIKVHLRVTWDQTFPRDSEYPMYLSPRNDWLVNSLIEWSW